MSAIARFVTRATLATCVLLAIAPPARAQKPRWNSILEASASALFGASSQTVGAFTAGVSHNGAMFDADASVKFRYGEAEDQEKGTFVTTRSWIVATSIDALPDGRVSPFFFGSAESSLEKRIAGRYSGGAGAKWVPAKSSTGLASVSAGLLGEYTSALSDTAIASTTLVRWSWRLKMQQKLDDRLSLSHSTFYAPVVSAPEQYTITTTSVGSLTLTSSIALTLTFTDNYDNQARTRGAPSNNDGSLLFGIRAKL